METALTCPAETDQLPSLESLANLTSFVTNDPSLLHAGTPSEAGTSVLVWLLRSGAEMERLVLTQKLPSPSSAATLGSAIANSTVRSLTIDTLDGAFSSDSQLIRALVASLDQRLEHLKIVGTVLSPEEAQTVASALMMKCSATLSELEICRCTLDYDACARLAAGIGTLKLIRAVTLHGNRTDDKGTSMFVQALTAGLRELRIRSHGSGFGPGTLMAVQKLLQAETGETIQTLDLSGNNMGDVGISALVDVRLPSLRQLSLSRNSFGPVGAQKLAHIIRRTHHLSSLHITFNHLGEEGSSALGKAIKDSCINTLEEFNITGCGLTSAEVTALFTPLRINTLRELRMDYNTTECAGLTAVTDCLLGGRIRRLSMCKNYIAGDIAAPQLAKSLKAAYALQTLNLSSNKLDGAEAVLDSINARYPMEELNMAYCCMEYPDVCAAARFIERVGCRRVDLRHIHIDAEDVIVLVDAIEASCFRTEALDLSFNHVGRQGAEYIAERLVKPDRSLAELNITMIGITDEGAKTLANALRGRRKEGMLRKLVVAKGDCGKSGLADILKVQEWENAVHGWSVIRFSSCE